MSNRQSINLGISILTRRKQMYEGLGEALRKGCSDSIEYAAVGLT